MSRHGHHRRDLDELAFPFRVKLAVPRGGLGRRLDDLNRWLLEEVSPGEHACHSGHGLGQDALCLYFRRLEDLARCLAEFPTLELADGTKSRAYTSPMLARRPGE